MIGPILGCGLLDPYKKNQQGYYEKHYNCCGPISLEKAFNAFYARQGITFIKNPAPRKLLSQKIQDRGMKSKELLSFFSREAICITWPNEIKYIADKYNFDLITVGDLDELDPKKDIAIVLIHGAFFSKEYHWVVYPVDDVEKFYGNKTVIDKIYLLKFRG